MSHNSSKQSLGSHCGKDSESGSDHSDCGSDCGTGNESGNDDTDRGSNVENGSDTSSKGDSESLHSKNESTNEYRKGGYHKVVIGEKYANRYVIEKKLGFGYFSTVWLASDDTKTDGDPHKLVAIKISKSEESFQEAAQDEARLLQTLGNHHDFTIHLLDQFTIWGPNGKHYCLVFETMWKDLFYLIKKFDYKGIPSQLLKVIVYQVLCGVEYIHSKDIIHTDIKPENFLLSLPFDIDVKAIRDERERYKNLHKQVQIYDKVESSASMSKNQRKRLREKLKKTEVPTCSEVNAMHIEMSKLSQFRTSDTLNLSKTLIVKVADLGNGCFKYRHHSSDITTRQYRSPEVLLGYPYSTPVDIFSCGVMFFELSTGHVLFQPEKRSNPYNRNEDHLSLIYRTTGYIPRKLIKEGKYSKHYFNRRCEFLHHSNQQPRPLIDLLRRKGSKEPDIHLFADFLSKCIEPDPQKRISASQAKLHPWLKDVHNSYLTHGLPAFNFNFNQQ